MNGTFPKLVDMVMNKLCYKSFILSLYYCLHFAVKNSLNRQDAILVTRKVVYKISPWVIQCLQLIQYVFYNSIVQGM